MKKIIYSILVIHCITPIFLYGMELEKKQVLTGTINVGSKNESPQYILVDQAEDIIKQLYTKYKLPSCIPCLRIGVTLNKNSLSERENEYNEYITTFATTGLPITILFAPPFVNNINHTVEFETDHCIFKLNLNKFIRNNIITRENKFICDITPNYVLTCRNELIKKEILKEDGSHGECGYPNYKNTLLFDNQKLLDKLIIENKNKLAVTYNSLTKQYMTLGICTALFGLGTAAYTWYKPNKSPIEKLFAASSFGVISLMSFFNAWHFNKMHKSYKK